MLIRTDQAITIRDPATGELTSLPANTVCDVSEEIGAMLIEDGQSEVVTDVTPEGTKDITENGVYDISLYAKVNVNVGGSAAATVGTAVVGSAVVGG